MKRISLTAWIFIGMAVGVLLGVFAPDIAKQLGPVSAVFLRLIRSIVALLIFATLVAGIAGAAIGVALGSLPLFLALVPIGIGAAATRLGVVYREKQPSYRVTNGG